jgi:hypothetical protein
VHRNNRLTEHCTCACEPLQFNMHDHQWNREWLLSWKIIMFRMLVCLFVGSRFKKFDETIHGTDTICPTHSHMRCNSIQCVSYGGRNPSQQCDERIVRNLPIQIILASGRHEVDGIRLAQYQIGRTRLPCCLDVRVFVIREIHPACTSLFPTTQALHCHTIAINIVAKIVVP